MYMSSIIAACLLSTQAASINPFSLAENKDKQVIHRPDNSGFSVRLSKHEDHLTPENLHKSVNRKYRLGSSILGEDYKP